MTGAKIGIYWISGGERGIRTLAGLTTTNGLANRPLKPLEYLSLNITEYKFWWPHIMSLNNVFSNNIYYLKILFFTIELLLMSL